VSGFSHSAIPSEILKMAELRLFRSWLLGIARSAMLTRTPLNALMQVAASRRLNMLSQRDSIVAEPSPVVVWETLAQERVETPSDIHDQTILLAELPADASRSPPRGPACSDSFFTPDVPEVLSVGMFAPANSRRTRMSRWPIALMWLIASTQVPHLLRVELVQHACGGPRPSAAWKRVRGVVAGDAECLAPLADIRRLERS